MVLLGRLLRTSMLLVLVCAAGCAIAELVGLTGAPVRYFSHAVHGPQEDLECNSCHRTYAKKDEVGMPRMKQCMLCHEGIDEDKAPEKGVLHLYGQKPHWSDVAKVSDDVKFSHQAHNKANLACDECHVGIDSSHAVTDRLRVTKSDCFSCHANEDVGSECTVCHTQIDATWEPENHKTGWKKLHGKVARAGSDHSNDRCELCHTEASCAECHRDEKPANHNAHWRHRAHGIIASIDRDACNACHSSDYCFRCHSETEPRSHTPSWGGTQDTHCVSCHSTPDDGCFTCHKLPAHVTAPVRPFGHASDPNGCRDCHLRPHLDDGGNCVQCHP